MSTVKPVPSFGTNHLNLTHLMLFFITIVIGISTYIIFSPVLKNKFTNWDDDRYIINNTDIRSLDKKHLKELVTKNYEGNYHPITMLSYAWNYSKGKSNPRVYIQTNLLLHIANTGLVLLFIWMLTNQKTTSIFTSVLFGIHPLHVESVAWISERKDVLYCFFFLLSLITYIYYIKSNKAIGYVAAIILFSLSLLSKAMAVPLALVLILIDLYFFKKVTTKNLWSKIPFITLSIGAGYIAIKAQQVTKFIDINSGFSLLERLAIASFGFINYLYLSAFPNRLAAFYPYPRLIPYYYWICLIIMVILFASLLIYLFKKFRFENSESVFLFGFLFFTLNIILVLQILGVGKALMADRYTYVSGIGLFIMIAYGIRYISQKFSNIKIEILFIASIYCTTLSYISYQQCKVWHDSISLWNNVISRYKEVEFKDYPGLDIAFNNRGLAKQNNGDQEGAFLDYEKTTQLNPAYALAWNNMGAIKAEQNHQTEAVLYFSKTITLNPNMINAYMNRAKSKSLLQDHNGALVDYTIYIDHFQGNPDIYNDRGREKYHLMQYEESIKDYTKAIALGKKTRSPNIHYYYLNRGVSYAFLKNFKLAFNDYNKALEIKPDYSEALNNRGILKLYTGDKNGGCADLSKSSEFGNQQAISNITLYCQK